MNLDILYDHAAGRFLLKMLQQSGAYKLGAFFLHTKASKGMIPSYIERNHIDMSEFEDQTYDSFAEFFGRRKELQLKEKNPLVLMSPCDSLLSVYPVQKNLVISMKGSNYRLCDLVTEREYVDRFAGGACLIFRLEASDYHHFCFLDDGIKMPTRFIPGQLHSVQPIACEKLPVYRLNRRWWTPLHTEHFGCMVQIEIGAMMVGGISHRMETGAFHRGEEMGNFELAGSTIALLIEPQVWEKLKLDAVYRPTWKGQQEVRVRLGDRLGELR